jgi:hypothetical protein
MTHFVADTPQLGDDDASTNNRATLIGLFLLHAANGPWIVKRSYAHFIFKAPLER